MSSLFRLDTPHLRAIVPPPALRAVMVAAHAELCTRLESLAPGLVDELVPWMERLAPEGEPPEAYFAHPLAFPLMSLPWWLDEALGGTPNREFQLDAVISSMCGYYAIRLIDDVMDRSPAALPELLPAVGVLHAEFQAIWMRWFPAEDPFWPGFYRAWAEGHEAAVLDSRLEDMDAAIFAQVAGRKVCAASIPLLAVARHHGLKDVPEAWKALFQALCPWHQLHNDVLDWRRDAERSAVTWLLCEGRRRALPGETVAGWVAREGFMLGVGWLEEGLEELRTHAQQTGSAAVQGYVEGRADLLARLVAETQPALATLIHLESIRRLAGLSA